MGTITEGRPLRPWGLLILGTPTETVGTITMRTIAITMRDVHRDRRDYYYEGRPLRPTLTSTDQH